MNISNLHIVIVKQAFWTKSIAVVLSLSFLLSSCQNINEKDRFANFLENYEEEAAKYFSETNLPTSDLDDSALLKRAIFCNKKLDELTSFDLMELSADHQKDFQKVVEELKERLESIEVLVKESATPSQE